MRIHAGRLRRALNEYYQGAGKDDSITIGIPKGAYVPAFSTNTGAIQQSTQELKKQQPASRKELQLPFCHLIMFSDASAVAFADGLADHISTALTRYSELSVISYYSCRNIIGKINDIKEAGMVLGAMYILTGTVQKDDRHLRIRVQLTRTETREQVWANSYERDYTGANLLKYRMRLFGMW